MTALSPMIPPQNPSRWQPQKMAWWYWALMDGMIAQPQKSLKDFADDFRVTPAAIYLITGSDLFKANLAARRKELQERIDSGISTALSGVALKSLGVVEKILDMKGEAIGMTSAVDVMDKTLGRLGYGPRTNGSSVNVQVNAPSQTNVTVPVSAQDLEDARRALRASELAKGVMPHVPHLPGGHVEKGEVGPGEILPPLSED